MTALELKGYLVVLAEMKVMQANLSLGDGKSIIVVFQPNLMPDLPGEAPEPGGWKSPPKLDDAEVMFPDSFPREVSRG